MRWRPACLPTTRRLVQLYAALLHNAYLKGIITGEIYQGQAKAVCFPGLNCYSCPGAVGACPLGALQNALASTGHRAGWYVLGILLLFGVTLGRTVCGWLCPAGLLQELLHRLPTPKLRKNRVTRALSWLKYGILAVFVLAIPLWFGLTQDLPLPAFCKYICPVGTLEGAVGHLANPANVSLYSMLGLLFTQKWVILVCVSLACIFCWRFFCRFLCPLGAIYGLFNRFSFVGIRVDEKRCNGCGQCVRHCGMDVRSAGDHECIQCGRCAEVCSQGAISLKMGKIVLQNPEKECRPDGVSSAKRHGMIRWGIALAVLAFALVWFNLLDPAVRKANLSASVSAMPATEEPVAALSAEQPSDAAPVSRESDAPLGSKAGEQLPDFTLTCYDGSVFHLAELRGKIVMINLWSTWCTPCKLELPSFSELCDEHPDDLVVLAVHPSMVVDDPEAYLAGRGYRMRFATDTGDNLLWNTVGGTTTLPQTVVLNRKGEVIYNAIGSVTPELLHELYEEADMKSR